MCLISIFKKSSQENDFQMSNSNSAEQDKEGDREMTHWFFSTFKSENFYQKKNLESFLKPWISRNLRIGNPVLFEYYRICSINSGFWGTEFGISLFSTIDCGFWNANHDF